MKSINNINNTNNNTTNNSNAYTSGSISLDNSRTNKNSIERNNNVHDNKRKIFNLSFENKNWNNINNINSVNNINSTNLSNLSNGNVNRIKEKNIKLISIQDFFNKISSLESTLLNSSDVINCKLDDNSFINRSIRKESLSKKKESNSKTLQQLQLLKEWKVSTW